MSLSEELYTRDGEKERERERQTDRESLISFEGRVLSVIGY
jgi:hypothetical protein